ncbi:hypothetical protein BH11PLA1_BH11PLA1_04360 [soil metagenome]
MFSANRHCVSHNPARFAAALAAVALAALPAAAQPAAPASTAASRPSSAPAAAAPVESPEARAQRMMKEMEDAARARGAAPQTPVAGPATETAVRPIVTTNIASPARGAIREGTFITARRGRLVPRSGSSLPPAAANPTGTPPELLFAFDGDANGRSEAPLVLLPCKNLEALERAVGPTGDSVVITLSGQIFSYHGRNYLMPGAFILNRRSELSPGG